MELLTKHWMHACAYRRWSIHWVANHKHNIVMHCYMKDKYNLILYVYPIV